MLSFEYNLLEECGMAYQVDEHTVSLLHFDNGIKDETGKAWTVNGKAAISTAQSKFGGASLYLGSTGDSISVQSPLVDLHSSPYTIEMWFYPTSIAGSLGDQYGVLTGFTGFADPYTGAAISYVKVTNEGHQPEQVSGINLCSVDKAALNTWHHVALTFDGTTTRLFLNGKLEGTSGTLNTAASLGNLVIGKTAGGYTYQFYGYIDEFRISNIARWTSDFDPETPDNPDNPDSGKLLLTVTLAEEVEREYDLTQDQVNAFINWYTARSSGTGAAFYTFDKSFNREDYLPFDKIITFEITDFTM